MSRACCLILLACILLSPVATWAAPLFERVPPERRAAAGLDKLTAAELAALEALVAELQASAPAAPASVGPGWLRALITLQETADQPDRAEVLETAIAGDYAGWNGRTVFRLANGQVWQQADGGTRIDSVRPAPRVRIYPGMLGAYWLEIEGVRERVKVKPVRLK